MKPNCKYFSPTLLCFLWCWGFFNELLLIVVLALVLVLVVLLALLVLLLLLLLYNY